MTGGHIKSINVQDVSIQRSLNLVRLPVPVEKDPVVYVWYSTISTVYPVSTATCNLVRLPVTVEKGLAVLYRIHMVECYF